MSDFTSSMHTFCSGTLCTKSPSATPELGFCIFLNIPINHNTVMIIMNSKDDHGIQFTIFPFLGSQEPSFQHEKLIL